MKKLSLFGFVAVAFASMAATLAFIAPEATTAHAAPAPTVRHEQPALAWDSPPVVLETSSVLVLAREGKTVRSAVPAKGKAKAAKTAKTAQPAKVWRCSDERLQQGSGDVTYCRWI